MLRAGALLLVLGFQSCLPSQTTLLRDKRQALLPPPLVYPFGGTLKLLVGHAMPIALPGRTLSYSQNLQFQFALPQNASFFADYFTARTGARRRRQTELLHERATFYGYLQREVHRRGGPGKECVKRSICESAETPLGDQGLVGEILQVLLTPDYGYEGQGGARALDEDYLAAAQRGRRTGDCGRAYDCPKGFGLLDHISRLHERD
ncbi:uncharacterized protein LOC131665095 [Phymastichus coffea]|uniref:uncharacterized protein LOC131665095 n=1 Tax=Phymastichus coffea TaxID=108790 RepID=UPI00273CE50A|nr:uncharacterized protein LOC131665095 [Phymastichus coffea]